MADVAARCTESLGQMGRTDGTRRLKEGRGEEKPFGEAKIIFGKGRGGERVKAACSTLDDEHGTFTKKGFNAHGQRFPVDLVINYCSIHLSMPILNFDCGPRPKRL